MNISINNFFSIRQLELSIEKGITVIAGKNGSGKSQLLLGIAQKNSSYNLLSEFGFSEHDCDIMVRQINIEPSPNLVLYRPPIRHLAENERNLEFAFCRPLNAFIDSNNKIGYSNQVQSRSQNIYAIISNFAIAANNLDSSTEMKKRWEILTTSFFDVFNKELKYDINIFNGIKVGVKISNNKISSLNTLSTGELEFISLMCDLLLEYEMLSVEDEDQERNRMTNRIITKADMILIDELDAHFHPDLQQKVIQQIAELCKDKYVIITTHSPSVMISTSPDRLFFLKSKDDTPKNQICRVSDDVAMYSYLADMYKGFVSDLNLSKHFSDANNKIVLTYAQQCLTGATVVDKSRDHDPQTSTIRSALLYKDIRCIVEVGSGKGRLLSAFKGFSNNVLSSITYYAVEPNASYHEEIRSRIKELRLYDRFDRINIVKSLPIDAKRFDFCFITNVLHEISPIMLSDFINHYLSFCNPNAIISILEVGRLAVGEDCFTLFYPEALEAIFSSYTEQCKLVPTIHYTYNMTPLYDVVIHIYEPSFRITINDVVSGLEKIIQIESSELYKNFTTKSLSAIEYAFRTHNLANAQAFLTALRM